MNRYNWVTAYRCSVVLCLLLFSYSVSFSQANKQVKELPVTDSDYYAFFNSTINPFPVITMGIACNPDSEKVCNLNSLPEYHSLLDDTTEIFKDTLFTMADRLYIKKQMARIKNFRWKDGEMKNMKVIDGDKVKQLFDSLGLEEGWKAYNRIYGLAYNRFSVPVFSCDKLKCIVFRGYECTPVYGLGNTNAFEYKNGKWSIIKSCSPWIH